MALRRTRYTVLGLIAISGLLVWWWPAWMADWMDKQHAWAILTASVGVWVLWTFVSVAGPVVAQTFGRLGAKRRVRRRRETFREFGATNGWSISGSDDHIVHGAIDGIRVRLDAEALEIAATWPRESNYPPFRIATFDARDSSSELESLATEYEQTRKNLSVFRGSSQLSPSPELEESLINLFDKHADTLSDLVIDQRGAIAYLSPTAEITSAALTNLLDDLRGVMTAATHCFESQ